MADIADSTAPIGCQSCFCDEAATPSANEGQMQLSIQAATGRRGRPPFIPHCDGNPPIGYAFGTVQVKLRYDEVTSFSSTFITPGAGTQPNSFSSISEMGAELGGATLLQMQLLELNLGVKALPNSAEIIRKRHMME
uniref:Uncharacterized protein n=1 Tax=Oryza glaberrima TaxID=4538 RepID=I1R1L8_ORYGL